MEFEMLGFLLEFTGIAGFYLTPLFQEVGVALKKVDAFVCVLPHTVVLILKIQHKHAINT